MTLAERVQAAITEAVRSRDELRRDTLRMAWNALYNAEKTARRPLTDDEAVVVLAREVRTRREAVEAYEQAGRLDLAAKEEAEIGIIGTFLPAPLSDAELEALVRAALEEARAAGPRDLGRVMGLLAPRTRGRADGKVVSALVAAELARRSAGR